MADAPSGGGGLSGGEIIVLVVLGLGALAVLSGNPIKPVTSPASSSDSSSHATNAAPVQVCGITLSRPVKNEKLSQVTTVTGTVNNCDPRTLAAPDASLQTVSLNVQVVDGNGAPMSALTPISLSAVTSYDSGSFNVNIPLIGAPAAGTGQVIVIGPLQKNGAEFVDRMPVTFR